MSLTSKQRAALRGMANTMEPVFQIGKGEIDETLIKGVDDCIKARELIKLKVLENSAYSATLCFGECSSCFRCFSLLSTICQKQVPFKMVKQIQN